MSRCNETPSPFFMYDRPQHVAMPTRLYPDLAGALLVLAKATMRPFEKPDFDAFAGVESASPMIGGENLEAGPFLVILDGSHLTLIHTDDAENECGHSYWLEADESPRTED